MTARYVRDRVRGAIAAALASVGTWASAAAGRIRDAGSVEPQSTPRSVGREIAVDSAVEGMIVVDDDGTVVDCNRVAADALGVDRGTVVGEPVAALDPNLQTLLDGALADEDPAADGAGPVTTDGDSAVNRDVDEMGHLTRMTADGKRQYEPRVVPFDRHGIEGRLLTLRDVTESRRLRRRVSVLNRLLRHDLRNEMNVVLGYTELIEDRLPNRTDDAGPEDEDGEPTPIDRITGAAETMLDRAETVRHVEATLDADGSARTRLDVVGLVRARIDGLAMEYSTADPQISLEAPDSAWVTATGLIDTVFDNLLENAIEHSHRERPIVEITVTESAGFVAVTVADDGPGIPSQELKTFQTEAETAVTHSSGLGLWLVVWITEASGGRVSFDVDETGTAVTVEFPAADPPE
mgnify:CR=1 FL=1